MAESIKYLSKLSYYFKGYLDVTFRTKVISGSKITYLFVKHLRFLKVFFPFTDNYLSNYLFKISRSPIIIKNEVGIFRVYPHDDSYGKSSPYFEKYFQDYISNSKENNIFIDIGANVGFYSFLALNKKNFQKVYCFEPNPDTFKLLKENISLNGYDDYIISNNIVLGSKTSKVSFEKNLVHTGGSKVVEKDQCSYDDKKQTVTLSQISFDSYILDKNISPSQITFIKIDVEGYEYEVLSGMGTVLTLLLRGTKIFIEIWPNSKYKTDTFALLKTYGFELETFYKDNYLFIKQ